MICYNLLFKRIVNAKAAWNWFEIFLYKIDSHLVFYSHLMKSLWEEKNWNFFMIKGNEDAIVTLDNPCSTWSHTSDDNQLLELEVCKLLLVCHSKVEKILEDILFRSHHLYLQENSNHWRESLLEVLRQKIAGWCQQSFCFQKFVDKAQQCFAFTTQANFPMHNLNFHWSWRWWDQIQATFKNLFYFMARVISKKADQRLPQHRNRWLMVVVIKHWGLKSIAIIALVIFGLLFNVLFALFWPYCGVLVASSRIAEILLFWYLFKRHP